MVSISWKLLFLDVCVLTVLVRVNAHDTPPSLLHSVLDEVSGDVGGHPSRLTPALTRNLLHRVLRQFGCQEAGFCKNCSLTPGGLFAIVDANNASEGLDLAQFKRSTVVMTYFIMKPKERCSSSVNMSRDSYEHVYAEALLHVTEHASGDAVDKVDHLIDKIGAHYEPHHDDDHGDHHDDDHGDHHSNDTTADSDDHDHHSNDTTAHNDDHDDHHDDHGDHHGNDTTAHNDDHDHDHHSNDTTAHNHDHDHHSNDTTDHTDDHDDHHDDHGDHHGNDTTAHNDDHDHDHHSNDTTAHNHDHDHHSNDTTDHTDDHDDHHDDHGDHHGNDTTLHNDDHDHHSNDTKAHNDDHNDHHDDDHKDHKGEDHADHNKNHEHHKCFSHKTIAAEVGLTATTKIDLRMMEEIAATILLHLVKGEEIKHGCEVLPRPGDFLDDLFSHFSSDDISVIPNAKFKTLLKTLQIGTPSSGGDGHSDMEDSHAAHDHRRRRGAASVSATRASRRTRRETPEHAEHLHKCLSADNLYQIFGVDERRGVSKAHVRALCPALIQQQVTGACAKDKTTITATKPTNAEIYGYGSVCVLVISLTSAVGLLLICCQRQEALHRDVITALMALAIGTLVGDAVLHLLPMAVGLHLHGPGDTHDHGATDGVTIEMYTWRLLAVLAAIYGLFILEIGLNALRRKGSKQDDVELENHGHSHLAYKPSGDEPEKRKQLDERGNDSTDVCCGVTTLALLVSLGDTLHNFADGLAIGATFSTSVTAGLATSIAVFCHELPHELGDFAVLISTGLSYKKALVLNVVSGLFAFAGLYVGIPISVDIRVQQWIFAVTAGIFLYIALVDMMPSLANHNAKSPIKHFLLVNIGILTGYAILFVLSVFEEHIKV